MEWLRWFYALPLRLRAIVRSRRVEQDLDDELSFHVAMQTQANVQSGMSGPEAERRARLTLGGIEQAKERSRDVRPLRWTQDFATDLRYTLRLLRKTPVFTLVAAGTLALGIGANTAMFSILDSVVLQQLPYGDPDRLVMVWEDATLAGFPRNTPAPGNYTEWRRRNRSFTDLAATQSVNTILTGDGAPEQVLGRAVTPSFFSVLGVQPLLGRPFTQDEDRTGAPVAVVSFALWRRRYGGDPSVIGRRILMNDSPYQVIGVMPRPFVFRSRDVDYWVPIHFTPAQAVQRNSHYLNVVARLKPGVSLSAADADMTAVAAALKLQFPDNDGSIVAVLVPLKEDLLGNTRLELIVLMAAAAATLLIACANLASLLLSRAAGRRGELAVRVALGATRGRLVRQMVIEGMTLSLAGGLLGLAVPPLATSLVKQLVPTALHAVQSSAFDWRLLGFSFLVSVATGLLFSIVPALHASRASLRDALQQNMRAAVGGSSRATRDALVVLQVSATLVLLVAAGLMLRTLANLRATDVGFRSESLLTMRTTLPQPKYADQVKRAAFYERVLAGVRGLPGIEHAAYASTLPFVSIGNTRGFRVEGRARRPGEILDALYRVGTNDYLQTLDVRLIDGRLIDERDVDGAPLVVAINETMARQYWPNESAVGRRVAFGPPEAPWITIIGVVKDVHERGYELAMKPGVYIPASQVRPGGPDNLIVRVTGDPAHYARQVERVIAGVDPAQPVAAVRTMDDIIDLNVGDRHQQMILLVAFGGLALLLVSLGLYGVLAQAVAARSREFGVRMALGATPRSVMTMVIARGVALTAVGTAVGAAAAWGVTRTMSSLLYGVAAADPATFAGVAGLLGLVALSACAFPAARAARLDPMVVLRDQ
jgi:predicted permease